MRVGELAAATGLTVRALHYYEEIGLVGASGRTPADHRIYSDADVERLYRVTMLQSLGLSLAEISRALDDPTWDTPSALAAHREAVDRRIEAETRLRARLSHLLEAIDEPDNVRTNDLVSVLEDMAMLNTNVKRRISVLVYRDIEAAYRHVCDVFALGPGQLTRDKAGAVVHGEVEAGDGVVWLHPESAEYSLASPATTGAASGSTAVLVEDVDAHYEAALGSGADIVYPPTDQPYGYREYSARDIEGHLWSFMRQI